MALEARKSGGRNVDGVLLLDKPVGLSSNAALQEVKRLFRARKAGHTGSLDPIASGLLPICLGQATKISAYLLGADKHYLVTGKLGEKTATGDAEGEIIDETAVPVLDGEQLETALDRFRGASEQLPPMYSALKHHGQRLYQLARKGVEVERQPRPIFIDKLELAEYEGDRLVLDVHCSKGTYVRTLLEDIAETLGTCGHVTALRRLGVGPYDGAGMVTTAELKSLAEQGTEVLDSRLLPLDSAVSHWPAVRVGSAATFYLRQGQPVTAPGGPASGLVRIYDADGGFVGVGEMTGDGRVAPRRLFQIE